MPPPSKGLNSSMKVQNCCWRCYARDCSVLQILPSKEKAGPEGLSACDALPGAARAQPRGHNTHPRFPGDPLAFLHKPPRLRGAGFLPASCKPTPRQRTEPTDFRNKDLLTRTMIPQNNCIPQKIKSLLKLLNSRVFTLLLVLELS